MAADSKYTIEIRDGSGNLVTILDKAKRRMFQLWRNKAGSASFELDLSDPKATWDNLQVGRYDVVFRRFGKPLYAGRITYVEPIIEGDTRTAIVRSTGYLDLFKDRVIMPASTLSFTATDAGTIAWTLINDSQNLTNGSFGVLQGTITTSVNRTRNYPSYKNIKDAIVELSAVQNGFDFDFTVSINTSTNVMTKKFNVYYPRQGQDQPTLRFDYPGNIKSVRRPKDATHLANEVIERGSGYGSQQALQQVDDTPSQLVYALRQVVENRPDVLEGATLTAWGNELLRVNRDPAELPTLTINGNVAPAIGTYGIGDSIKVNVQQAGLLNFSNLYKIEGIEVGIDENDDETIALRLEMA